MILPRKKTLLNSPPKFLFTFKRTMFCPCLGVTKKLIVSKEYDVFMFEMLFNNNNIK